MVHSGERPRNGALVRVHCRNTPFAVAHGIAAKGSTGNRACVACQKRSVCMEVVIRMRPPYKNVLYRQGSSARLTPLCLIISRVMDAAWRSAPLPSPPLRSDVRDLAPIIMVCCFYPAAHVFCRCHLWFHILVARSLPIFRMARRRQESAVGRFSMPVAIVQRRRWMCGSLLMRMSHNL